MRIGRKTAALFLAVFVSASAAVPAFASHKVIDKDTYIIETNEDEETTCTYVESGKPVTGWIEDEDGEYRLHLLVRTLLSTEKKEQLLSVSGMA